MWRARISEDARAVAVVVMMIVAGLALMMGLAMGHYYAALVLSGVDPVGGVIVEAPLLDEDGMPSDARHWGR